MGAARSGAGPRRRDYVDVARSGFLVWGGVVTACLCGKFDYGGGRRRSSREQVPLTVEPSSCIHPPHLRVPPPPLLHLSVFCLRCCFSLSFLIFSDLQAPPELSGRSGPYTPPPVPTCHDQCSQGGVNPGENTPLCPCVAFDMSSGHPLEHLWNSLEGININSSCKLQKLQKKK